MKQKIVANQKAEALSAEGDTLGLVHDWSICKLVWH